MQKLLLAALSSIIIFTTSYGQQGQFNCEKNLDKVPYFIRHNAATGNADSVRHDIRILKECGKLDPIDSVFLTGPAIGSILVAQSFDGNEITYRSILKNINEFKKTKNYEMLRDAALLENRIVDLSNWEEDRKLLSNAGMPESEIEGLKKYVEARKGEKMTFREAYTRYSSSKANEQAPAGKEIKFPRLGDLDDALKTGTERGKPILLYFTGYACVNARKMDDRILTNEQVTSLLMNNYVYFSAYVDDKTLDPQTNATVGSKYAELQSGKFKNSYQPYFVIIDDKGNILAEQGYTASTEEFVGFLKKGIK